MVVRSLYTGKHSQENKVLALPGKFFETLQRSKQTEEKTSVLDKELFHSGPNEYWMDKVPLLLPFHPVYSSTGDSLSHKNWLMEPSGNLSMWYKVNTILSAVQSLEGRMQCLWAPANSAGIFTINKGKYTSKREWIYVLRRKITSFSSHQYLFSILSPKPTRVISLIAFYSLLSYLKSHTIPR